MQIKVGDYFDLYQDGKPTRRVMATTDMFGEKIKYCLAVDIDILIEKCISAIHKVDVDNEVEKVIGNIFVSDN